MASRDSDLLDVIIIGGGPAGLSAALVLGRCRRRTIVFDAGHPRNEASHALHGYLTRDGISPAEFLRIGREQLAPYDTIELRPAKVIGAKAKPYFEVTNAANREAPTVDFSKPGSTTPPPAPPSKVP